MKREEVSSCKSLELTVLFNLHFTMPTVNTMRSRKFASTMPGESHICHYTNISNYHWTHLLTCKTCLTMKNDLKSCQQFYLYSRVFYKLFMPTLQASVKIFLRPHALEISIKIFKGIKIHTRGRRHTHAHTNINMHCTFHAI